MQPPLSLFAGAGLACFGSPLSSLASRGDRHGCLPWVAAALGNGRDCMSAFQMRLRAFLKSVVRVEACMGACTCMGPAANGWKVRPTFSTTVTRFMCTFLRFTQNSSEM